MKKNIKLVDYRGEESPTADWWTWEEYCDRCGKQTRNTALFSSRKPDPEEIDLCSDCIRQLLRNQKRM